MQKELQPKFAFGVQFSSRKKLPEATLTMLHSWRRPMCLRSPESK